MLRIFCERWKARTSIHFGPNSNLRRRQVTRAATVADYSSRVGECSSVLEPLVSTIFCHLSYFRITASKHSAGKHRLCQGRWTAEGTLWNPGGVAKAEVSMAKP